MYKFSLFLLMLLFVNSALAERFKDTIHSIDLGTTPEEDHILKLESGRVAFISPDDFHYEKNAQALIGEYVEIEVDDQLTVLSLTSLPREEIPQRETETETEIKFPTEKMTPTVIRDWNTAMRIWNGMNRSYKQVSECSDRAHVWAYEEWRKHNLYSMKAFLFFTNTYIRAYRYNWWFHVSPYALVHEYGRDVEHVFDRRYASIPRHFKEWTDIFIRSRKACPVTTYRHYRNNRNGPEHCFVVKSTMYYRLPLHVRNLEDSGIVKTQFSTSEVNFSYRAFTRRGVQ
ncbi:MAG TPA: protein-glutamine glutaminase family protein [Bacteriovoracaceae bacterium]|nr:protein-glutamine glutaminase family protein [Bacteriovoracaceae bacterium]